MKNHRRSQTTRHNVPRSQSRYSHINLIDKISKQIKDDERSLRRQRIENGLPAELPRENPYVREDTQHLDEEWEAKKHIPVSPETFGIAQEIRHILNQCSGPLTDDWKASFDRFLSESTVDQPPIAKRGNERI